MQNCKSIYTTTTGYIFQIIGSRHNPKTILCHGLFQLENERQFDRDNLLTTLQLTQMRARVERVDMLRWTLSGVSLCLCV